MTPITLPPTPAELRQAALNDKDQKGDKFLTLGGRKYVVAAPTIGEAEDIQSRSVKVIPGRGGKNDVKLDSATRKALAIVRLVRAEDGKPVFEETDMLAILAAKRGGFIDKLGEAALAQLGLDEEAVEGN